MKRFLLSLTAVAVALTAVTAAQAGKGKSSGGSSGGKSSAAPLSRKIGGAAVNRITGGSNSSNMTPKPLITKAPDLKITDKSKVDPKSKGPDLKIADKVKVDSKFRGDKSKHDYKHDHKFFDYKKPFCVKTGKCIDYHGHCYHGKHFQFWSYCKWYPDYGCHLYWCPVKRVWFYWCEPYGCYYPIDFCPTGVYAY